MLSPLRTRLPAPALTKLPWYWRWAAAWSRSHADGIVVTFLLAGTGRQNRFPQPLSFSVRCQATCLGGGLDLELGETLSEIGLLHFVA